jgi:hypothetical protein
MSSPEITPASSETPVPTAFYTPTFTPVPATASPMPTQTALSVAPTEPVLLMLNPTKAQIFVIGITNQGGRHYSLGDGTPFRILYEPPGGFTALRFLVILSNRLNDELTLSQITSLTRGWHILIYCYRTNEIYSNQPVLILDDFQVEINIDGPNLTIDVKKEALQAKFGDCRAFTFQLADEKGNLEQGNFVLNPDSEGPPVAADGGLIGYPYSVHENETVFFREGEFITVQEPRGGFYRLYYMFNFVRATGVTATIEQEALANELTINLFPYQSDGDYSASDSYPVIGEIRSTIGVYTVDLPIDSLKENVNDDNMYYLQIVDGKGNTIQDDYFIFVPYTP